MDITTSERIVPVNPNLSVTFTYKDLLFRKLYNAIICSVLSQILILHVSLILINGDIFNPLSWIKTSFETATSFTAWLYVMPHMAIVFAQCLICAKDYVLRPTFSSNRFSMFFSVFSLHNLVLVLLHCLVGIVQVWLVLSLVGGDFKRVTKVDDENVTSLVEESMFLQLGGLWIGLYYFIKVYMSEKHLNFPIVQQKKLTQFKSSIFPLLKGSLKQAIWPCMYFILFYKLCGGNIKSNMAYVFDLQLNESFHFKFFFFHLLFSALYFFNMNLIKLFFSIFLTEPVEFPLVKLNENILTLQESLKLEKLPIVQSLACLDLYRLSLWSPARRQLLFTLSQPGEHPHNWNSLIENILNLYNSYIDILSKSSNSINEAANLNVTSSIPCQTPLPNKFRNLRSMTSPYSPVEVPRLLDVNSPQQNKIKEEKRPDSVFVPSPAFQSINNLILKIQTKASNFLATCKEILGINYLFGEIPQANIQKCLSDVHLIIWSSQGLSELICASIREDQYGVVQKDLSNIISTLVRLSQVVDKLNKLPTLTKRVISDNLNIRTKNAISSSLRRSLFSICHTFKNYLCEIPLTKEVNSYLSSNIIVKN